MIRGRGWRYAFAGILSFVSSLTIGNDPYLFFGYGISALGMLTTGLLLDPAPATVIFLVASAAAMSITALTHSAFTLVIVGAVLVRTLQVYLLSRFRGCLGPLGASVGIVLLGTILATLLGFAFYGGDALSTTMTFFDAVFILPAYVLVGSINDSKSGSLYLGGATLLATFGVFLSASPYLIPLATLVGVLAFAIVAFLTLGRGASKRISVTMLVFALVAMPLTLATNATALSYNTRNAFYPLYPDSLSASQWMQTNSSSACMQGNVAGAGTVQSGVWGPQRLRVLDTCITVSGVIEGLTPTSGPANDNDFGIDIRTDPQYGQTLSICNFVLGRGFMHVEVVPSQQASMATTLASLKPGEKIAVTGTLVLDTDHGFGAEIHPAWAIVAVSSG